MCKSFISEGIMAGFLVNYTDISHLQPNFPFGLNCIVPFGLNSTNKLIGSCTTETFMPCWSKQRIQSIIILNQHNLAWERKYRHTNYLKSEHAKKCLDKNSFITFKRSNIIHLFLITCIFNIFEQNIFVQVCVYRFCQRKRGGFNRIFFVVKKCKKQDKVGKKGDLIILKKIYFLILVFSIVFLWS